MPKIAIIEDDLAIAEMYKLKFEALGYQVEIAGNGKLGLELCQRLVPDLVMLDLMMPEMNGDEMLEKMRATEWGKDIKVIILTNVEEQEASTKLSSLHVLKYIVKAEMTPSQVAEVVGKELAVA